MRATGLGLMSPLLAAALGASLVGCGSAASQPAPAPGGTSSTQQEPAGFPVAVQNCGRSLTFQRPPSRVVTGYQPVFENLAALGLGDRIIGRLNFSENGPEGFLPGQKAIYDKIPEISDTIAFPPKEVMLAQRPDFVISEAADNFDASEGVATIEDLNRNGAPVFITGNWCSRETRRTATITDIFNDLTNLGKIFGVPDRAAQLRAQLEGMLADVADDSSKVSAEKIAASRPDAVLVLDYATLFGKAQPTAQTKADSIFRIAASSSAAQQRRFLPVPAAAAHSGYRNILEIREIARFLHPDAFR